MPTWTAGHWIDSNATIPDEMSVNDFGITVVASGASTSPELEYIEALPSTLSTDDQDIPYGMDMFRQNRPDFPGVYFLKEEDDFIWGEIQDRLVYWYFSPSYIDENADLNKLITQPILKSFNDEFLKELREVQKVTNLERFKLALNTANTTRMNNVRREITDFENQINSYLRHITEYTNHLRERRMQMEFFTHKEEVDQDSWDEQWNALHRFPDIDEINFINNDILQVKTVDLDMVDPQDGRITNLGVMQIDINCTTFSVEIHNLTNKRLNRDHPHVENGGPCWGNIGPNVSRMIGEGDIAQAIDLILQYLKSYNPDDDWGRYANLFFAEIPQPAEAEPVTE